MSNECESSRFLDASKLVNSVSLVQRDKCKLASSINLSQRQPVQLYRFTLRTVIRFEIKRSLLPQKVDNITCSNTTLNTKCRLRKLYLTVNPSRSICRLVFSRSLSRKNNSGSSFEFPTQTQELNRAKFSGKCFLCLLNLKCGLGRFELGFEDGSVEFLVGKLEGSGERLVDGFVGWEELVAHTSRVD